MLLDSFFKFLERLGVKLAPLLFAVWLSCTAALTLPYRYTWFAGAKSMIEPYRGWLILALIGSTAYLFVLGIGKLGGAFVRSMERRRFNRGMAKRLANLTIHEKHVLQCYLDYGTRTLGWSIDEPIIASLVAYGILFRSSSFGNMLDYPHDVQDDVWNYLQENPAVVATPGIMRTELDRRGRMRW